MQQATEYRQKVTEMKEAVLSENVDAKGMKLQKSSVASEMEKDTNTLSGTWGGARGTGGFRRAARRAEEEAQRTRRKISLYRWNRSYLF